MWNSTRRLLALPSAVWFVSMGRVSPYRHTPQALTSERGRGEPEVDLLVVLSGPDGTHQRSPGSVGASWSTSARLGGKSSKSPRAPSGGEVERPRDRFATCAHINAPSVKGAQSAADQPTNDLEQQLAEAVPVDRRVAHQGLTPRCSAGPRIQLERGLQAALGGRFGQSSQADGHPVRSATADQDPIGIAVGTFVALEPPGREVRHAQEWPTDGPLASTCNSWSPDSLAFPE